MQLQATAGSDFWVSDNTESSKAKHKECNDYFWEPSSVQFVINLPPPWEFLPTEEVSTGHFTFKRMTLKVNVASETFSVIMSIFFKLKTIGFRSQQLAKAK